MIYIQHRLQQVVVGQNIRMLRFQTIPRSVVCSDGKFPGIFTVVNFRERFRKVSPMMFVHRFLLAYFLPNYLCFGKVFGNFITSCMQIPVVFYRHFHAQSIDHPKFRAEMQKLCFLQKRQSATCRFFVLRCLLYLLAK
jgi:hypothetical protein